ncbi:MAG TPA: histidine phosphatase family protein, partial [Dehalococcoidia bacterium]|nr:histidine phosphatase family protein [Dehalococcoidia bacterium]
MRLFLVRHAESQGNREMRLQGRQDFPLTSLGRRQADALGARFSGRQLSGVYASPIRRALDTATPIAERAGVAVQ